MPRSTGPAGARAATARRHRVIAVSLVPIVMAAVTLSGTPASGAATTATTTATSAPSTTTSTKPTSTTTATTAPTSTPTTAATARTTSTTAAPTTPTTVAGPPTTPADEAFRATLATYLKTLGDALNAAAANPHAKASIAPHLQDYRSGLALAKAQVPTLDAAALEAAEGVLGQHPGWASQPAAVASALAAPTLHPNFVPVPFPGYLSNCSGFVPDNRGLFYGYWAAAQVASAANAVASSVPDGSDFLPLVFFAGVAFGIANGIAIGLQAALNLGLDCATAHFNAILEGTYPTDPVTLQFVPASSQISVDSLAAVSGSVKTTLDDIQAVINVITTKLANTINLLGTAQGTANNILATVTDLQGRTDALLATVGTAADTGTGTANGLANTINGKLDTILANTAAFQALSLQMEIERDLAAPNSPVVTLYALPAAQGGYLELVRTIVTNTLNEEVAAGQPVTGQPQVLLSRGNAAFAGGQFEAAFVQYALAYKAAVQGG